MKNRKYYAATNSYSTSTSIGFSNTWDVIVFDSKQSRDAFVDNDPNLATRAITKREVTNYANNGNSPRPFSGQYWGIDRHAAYGSDTLGLIGAVRVCDCYDNADPLHG